MKQIVLLLMLVALVLAGLSLAQTSASATDQEQACWGMLSAIDGQLGVMGEHASSFAPEPRIGLRNLARYAQEQGWIEDDTLQALGEFLNDALGLEVEACM
jgi:hypothetical protein